MNVEKTYTLNGGDVVGGIFAGEKRGQHFRREPCLDL